MRRGNEVDPLAQHIFDSVKHSLERLQLDYIDVLQCHRFDKDTPIEETVSMCVVRLMPGADMWRRWKLSTTS